MRKIEWGTIGLIVLWILVWIVLGLINVNNHAYGQDNVDVTACYTRTDAGVVFTFSNIPDNWISEGWYFIGDDAQLNDHTLTVTGLQFDEGYSYAIIGVNDYSENLTADSNSTSLCVNTSQVVQSTLKSPINTQISTVAPVISTGRTCVVKYPEIILVCSP